jgi:hypothetical protein
VIAARAILVLATLAALTSPVQGQTCHGTSRGGGIALEHGSLSIGRIDGATIALAGSRVAFGAAYRYRDINTDQNGHEGEFRFSLLFGGSRLLICPTVGLDYQRDTWSLGDGQSIISNRVAGRGGVNAGLDLPIGGSFVVTPFAGARYEFAVIAFEAAGGSAETNVTGDTLSHVDIEYGAIVHYRGVFGGVITNRYSDLKRPYMARLVLGFGFGGTGRR